MKMCKKNGCREPSLIGGKQYCKEHMAIYRAKSAEYFLAQLTFRKCAHCKETLTKNRHDLGSLTCLECETRIEKAQEECAYEDRKGKSFDDASTVEELKEWISQYIYNRVSM